MKAYQRMVRERKAVERMPSLFSQEPDVIDLKKATIRPINFKTAERIILEYEWIGTMPLPKSCRFMYGIYFDGFCGGAVVFVEPSTRQFNKYHPRQAVQLNRGACVHWTPRNTASRFIACCLRLLKEEGIKIIVAYCTREAGEYGTIYQALGWDYVGDTEPSYSYWLDNHWIAERTLADKKKWAKGKSIEWQVHFDNLRRRRLEGKFKYVKLMGTKQENREIRQQYTFYEKPYPKRSDDSRELI